MSVIYVDTPTGNDIPVEFSNPIYIGIEQYEDEVIPAEYCWRTVLTGRQLKELIDKGYLIAGIKVGPLETEGAVGRAAYGAVQIAIPKNEETGEILDYVVMLKAFGAIDANASQMYALPFVTESPDNKLVLVVD